jgi:4-hydroxy-tetrahydrodipicolinate synthase
MRRRTERLKYMSTPQFSGTLTALATPFHEKSLEIDYASLDKLIEFQLGAGVDGIVACGSTAEAASLSDQEYNDLLIHVNSRCKGKALCVGGVITNNTKKACQMAALISSQKFDAILLVTPPYIKPTQEGIIEHFRAVKAASNIPIIAYNIPGRAACLILPETIAKLSKEGLISGLKDSTGSVDHMLEVYALCGNDISILSGEDTLVHPIMTCGGKGVISACANIIPEKFVAITSSASKGDWKKSLDTQNSIQKIIKTMFIETNPIPVKTALELKGLFKSDVVRVPLTRSRPETREKISALLPSL